MPQTRFVTQKAFDMGLRPIVVINKIDRPSARPDWVLDQTFDLFDRLEATDEQLDFPVVYTSALHGYASLDSRVRDGDMTPLLETIVTHVEAPDLDPDGPLQLQVSALDYNSYVGVIGIGRIARGKVQTNTPVSIVSADGSMRDGRILAVMGFHGLERVEVPEAQAGDIIVFTGVEGLKISDTLCDRDHPEALPPLSVDEPTINMTFQVNTSPMAGLDGKYVTSRNLRERLGKELLSNVALRVEPGADADKFRVSGRGELHLSILIENMRREGFELAVSRPEVIIKEDNGVKQEPYEQLTVDVEEHHQGSVMEMLGERGGDVQNIVPDGKERVRLDYIIPSRGLFGFRTEFLSATQGTGLLYHVFDHYGPVKSGDFGVRNNGVLVANSRGSAVGYALWNLQERGRLFIGHGDAVYEGMIVGIHCRSSDLVVNARKGKHLTNVRASGTDEAIDLTPPIRQTLEQALEFINDDELVEVTPQFIRLRKRLLTQTQRKRASRPPKAPKITVQGH